MKHLGSGCVWRREWDHAVKSAHIFSQTALLQQIKSLSPTDGGEVSGREVWKCTLSFLFAHCFGCNGGCMKYQPIKGWIKKCSSTKEVEGTLHNYGATSIWDHQNTSQTSGSWALWYPSGHVSIIPIYRWKNLEIESVWWALGTQEYWFVGVDFMLWASSARSTGPHCL